MNTLDVLLKFQKDLRDGMSISDACEKHEVNWGYAFENMRRMEAMVKAKTQSFKSTSRVRGSARKRKSKIKVLNPSRYIFQRNNTFAVRKSVNGKTKIFGTYNSLDDACKVRDELERVGWNQRRVDSVCERLGVVRRKGFRNSSVRYH